MSPVRPAAALAAAGLLAAGAWRGVRQQPAAGPSVPAVPARRRRWDLVRRRHRDRLGDRADGRICSPGGELLGAVRRPAGPATWRLATPPGVADNGGLVVTGTGGASLLTGFVPSQDLTFSPLAATSDNGASWSPAGPVNPGLADAPDALAAGTGRSPAGPDQRRGRARHSSRDHVDSPGHRPGAGRDRGRPGLRGDRAHRGGVRRRRDPDAGYRLRPPGGRGHLHRERRRLARGRPGRARVGGREDVDVVRLAATGTGVVALLRAGTRPGRAHRRGLVTPAAGGPCRRRCAPGPCCRPRSDRARSVGVILSGGRATPWPARARRGARCPRCPGGPPRWPSGPGGQVGRAHRARRHVPGLAARPAGLDPGPALRVTIPYGSSS